MKMILERPQVPGSGGDTVVAARMGVQAIDLGLEGNFVRNSGDQEQRGMGRYAVSIPRPNGGLLGWPDSGGTGHIKLGFTAQICGCSPPNVMRQDDRRAIRPNCEK